MKNFKYLFLLVFLACSSPKIIYDYDSQTNFKQYKTFNFFEDAGKGLSDLDKKRMEQELITELEGKGMKLSDNPDMYINILSEERPSINRNRIGIGIGSGGRNVGFGISGGIPIESRKINQQITIDFVESKNNQLIWQSISNSEIKERTTPEERSEYYKSIINKVLVNYPPKSK